MRWMKWAGVLSAIILVIACCMVWVTIPSKNISVSGIDTTGTNFGRPAYFHFIVVPFFLFFSFMPRVWAKRGNLVATALNLAWAIRNYFIITMCRGGECPEKEIAVYIVVLASVLMLVSALFPDIKLKNKSA